jgi:hypothetical protein
MFPTRYFSITSYFYWPTDYWPDLISGAADAGTPFDFGTVYDTFVLESKATFSVKEKAKTFFLKG